LLIVHSNLINQSVRKDLIGFANAALIDLKPTASHAIPMASPEMLIIEKALCLTIFRKAILK